MKRWKKIFYANQNQDEAGVTRIISDKIDLKPKTVTRDKEDHFIIIKGSFHQEDITCINIYAPTI